MRPRRTSGMGIQAMGLQGQLGRSGPANGTRNPKFETLCQATFKSSPRISGHMCHRWISWTGASSSAPDNIAGTSRHGATATPLIPFARSGGATAPSMDGHRCASPPRSGRRAGSRCGSKLISRAVSQVVSVKSVRAAGLPCRCPPPLLRLTNTPDHPLALAPNKQ